MSGRKWSVYLFLVVVVGAYFARIHRSNRLDGIGEQIRAEGQVDDSRDDLAKSGAKLPLSAQDAKKVAESPTSLIAELKTEGLELWSFAKGTDVLGRVYPHEAVQLITDRINNTKELSEEDALVLTALPKRFLGKRGLVSFAYSQLASGKFREKHPEAQIRLIELYLDNVESPSVEWPRFSELMSKNQLAETRALWAREWMQRFPATKDQIESDLTRQGVDSEIVWHDSQDHPILQVDPRGQ